MEKYLFVCGSPRSGTTLLARLLGENESVVLGIERYKHLSGNYVPELFSEEKFFDLKEQNRINQEYYDKAKKKFGSARYVGKKLPNLYKRITKVNQAFQGNAVFIFCYRDLFEVAASWNVRAKNPKDKWPEENDFLKAAEAWADSFSRALQAKNEGATIIPFGYNKFVDYGEEKGKSYYMELLAKLGLQIGPVDEKVLSKEFSKIPTIKSAREVVTDEMKASIESHIDIDVMMRFMKEFKVGRIGMPDIVQSAWAAYLQNKAAERTGLTD